MSSFKALRIHEAEQGTTARIDDVTLDDLSEGAVEIRTSWSGINFKDALAVTGKGKIARKFPLVAGIDAAGTVEASEDPRYKPGQKVVITGWGMGENHDGGYAERTRVRGDWVVPLPDELDLRRAMIVGTAGFTAAMALVRMEQNGQRPDQGPVVITGASGGVGSFATRLFSRAGYQVTAMTGKADAADYLRGLGASDILDPAQVDFGKRPLEKAEWAGAVDALGGEPLTWLTRTTQPFGNIAAIGLAQGIELNTSVMPFILRGVNLLGIESVYCPMTLRLKIWERLGELLHDDDFDAICNGEIGLDQVPSACAELMDRKVRGRTLVRLSGEQ
ncbi:oxidoreductase [Aquisalimonas sp. 2447]|uniref:oxidoreductase n=1 Tax=Aquisalimonas sp. 2447 TaxID=2740807 RepID=UPI0014327520|nr:oxidoreductase [Aquisalimonas sp. 2447]QIT53826.1 oxidoreductase [Aquisalimonas sp. 2447]